MAGHLVTIYLKEKGHEVVGFARKQSGYVKTIVGDAFDTSLILESVTAGGFDVIVNCIGILNQFAENDKSAAVFLNAYLPHFLAKITSKTATRVFHISTDCVFSGKNGPYTESSLPDGVTFYDRSKALGEIIDDKNLTMRCSIVGPDIKRNGIGLLNWFMQQTSEVNGYTCAKWTGQTTLQLAKTIEAAASVKICGLINMVPESNISKYELLRLFNHYLRHDEVVIRPVQGIVADKTLIRTNDDFNYKIPDYDVMLRDLAEWIKNHKSLYPHYNI